MEKKFEFGKIAYYGNRKENLVTVEVELKYNNDGKPVFTACGNVWNRIHTDILMGGQCLDEIAKYIKNPKFRTIYLLWKRYHLNDMHAGTPAQEEALYNAIDDTILLAKCSYESKCKYLDSIGLYEVEHDGKPYKYGHGWIYYEIPEEDLNLIKSLFMEEN